MRAKRAEEPEPTNIETFPTSTTEEGKSDNNIITTEWNIEENGEEIEEEKAGVFDVLKNFLDFPNKFLKIWSESKRRFTTFLAFNGPNNHFIRWLLWWK